MVTPAVSAMDVICITRRLLRTLIVTGTGAVFGRAAALAARMPTAVNRFERMDRDEIDVEMDGVRSQQLRLGLLTSRRDFPRAQSQPYTFLG